MAPGSERDVLNRAKTFVICNASATNLRINPDFSAVFGYLNVNLSSPRANLTYPRDNRFFLLENGSEILYNIEKSERGAEMKNGKICILIADDEKEIRDILRLLLTGEGYAVCTAENGKEALVLASAEVDLYLLDVNMPELSGFMAGSEIRKQFNAPIIFLTAYSGESDKVMGFSAGADDYIVKPFSNMELLMRVKAILRRSARGTAPAQEEKKSHIPFGDLILDLECQSVLRQGEVIVLTYTEFKILELLVTHKKKIYSLENIYQSIWEEDAVGDSAIMVHIKNIRKKLEDDSRNPRYIKTAWGRGIMLISEKRRNTPKLSREIMGLLCITAAIALFFFGFLYLTANAIASTYLLENDILLTEGQLLTLQGGIRSLSLLSAVLLFLALFLFLLGQKMAYLREIIQGVEALRTHRMDFTMPIEGDNELKELAESINFLSETERRLRQLETELQAEKEQLIRDLSHDIRTPLTAMLSYSDYLGRKETLEQEEVQEYIALVQRKGQQIKALTDRLLDSGSRDLETIEDGKLLMEQLAGEWEEILENTFPCIVDTKNCPAFYGSFDIQELRRIFDNLASNVEKYADREQPVELRIDAVDKRLRVCQRNGIKTGTVPVESNQIGLESIRRIAALYGGMVKVSIEQGIFSIQITLSEVDGSHL